MLETLRSVLRFRRFELDSNKRRLATAANTDDLRRIAKRRLPAGVFDYIDGGAEDERTMRANRDAFARYRFRPRVLRDVSAIDTTTSLLGRELALPLVLAPTGFTRIADPQGELAVARAAERAGVPYALSTLSTRSIEEVAAANGTGRRWFQVYVWKDKALLRDMIDRAAASGYEALVITVDTANLGRRERDVRHGFTLPPKLGLDSVVDGIRHPSWTWRFVRAEPIRFANVATSAAATGQPEGTSAVNLAATFSTQFDPRLSWDDIEWFRSDLERADRHQGHPVRRRRSNGSRSRRRRHRPVQPRRPATRRCSGCPRARRTRCRRRGGTRRDHLRWRRAPG